MSSSLAPFVLLAMPFIEIAGFVIVGSKIGVFATLGLVILSAMLGFFLLRVQGIGLLQRIRTETAAGRVPDREVVHGAMLVLAAILLIVPGFVSSAVGILLFIPFIRDFMWEKFMRGRMVVATSTRYSTGYGHQSSGRDPRTYHRSRSRGLHGQARRKPAKQTSGQRSLITQILT